uniref:CPG4 domain-containing protein n=1 Tax=Rhabditophanes sp. KR3021 TaxID=114890 RepID=A0AC35UAE2_9BILA
MEGQLGQTKARGLLNLNYNDFLVAFSNQTFFEQFCGLYNEFQTCYNKCPPSYIQELLSRSSDIVDQFCVYNFKAIKEKFPCLGTLNREVSKQCMKVCTKHHDAVTSMMSNFRHLAQNGDSSHAEKYLEEGCEYVVCTLQCDVPTIAHFCDFETANLVIHLTRKSFASMQSMALDTGVIKKWPATCNDLKRYALPTLKDTKVIEGNTINVVESTTQVITNKITSSTDKMQYSIIILLISTFLLL